MIERPCAHNSNMNPEKHTASTVMPSQRRGRIEARIDSAKTGVGAKQRPSPAADVSDCDAG